MSWFFKGDQTWIAYSAADSASIEAAYSASQKDGTSTFQLNPTYSIDFDKSVQHRNDDLNRWRSIKRDPPAPRRPKAGRRAAAAKKGKRKVDDDDEEEEEEDEEEDEEEEEEDDEEYKEDDDKDDEEPPPRKAPAPRKPAAKKPTKPVQTKPSTPSPTSSTVKSPVAAVTGGTAATGPDTSAAARRVRELEEEKKTIVNDYEQEIEGLHKELAAAKEESDNLRSAHTSQQAQQKEVEELRAQLRDREVELTAVRAELAELRHDHDALVQTLSTATTIIGKRGKATPSPPLNPAAQTTSAGAKPAGVKRGREEKTDEPPPPAPGPKRPHVDDDATQLVSQTLVLDDVDMTSLYSVYNPVLFLSPSKAFRGQLERHLINPATLNHSLRPICSLAVSRDELVVGFTGGRLELWDTTRYHQKAVVKETPAGRTATPEKVRELDDEGKGDSDNVYCLAVLTTRAGDRCLLVGRGRHLCVYTLSPDALTLRRTVDHGRGGFVSCLCVTREGLVCAGVTGASFRVEVHDAERLCKAGRLTAALAESTVGTLAVRSSEVRKVVQLNDGRVAVAGCTSLQTPAAREESGAIELWSLPSDGSPASRDIIPSGPSVLPSIGIRCNAIAVVNPMERTDPQATTELMATYEYCTTGDRMVALHSLTVAASTTGEVEAQVAPPADENTYTGMAAYAGGSVMAMTYGGTVLHWRRVGGRGWVRVRVRAEDEADMEDSSVVTLEDGRVVTTGGKGSVKLWL